MTVSVLEKTGDELSANRTCSTREQKQIFQNNDRKPFTWVATYAIEAAVTLVMPWIRALPDRVALGSLSTELGEVDICLYACIEVNTM